MIILDIIRRNRLRREHGLPLLNVSAEFAHQLSTAQWREYHATCEAYAAEREAIRQEVLTEFRAKHGPNFGLTMYGRWAVGRETSRRFKVYLAQQHGILPPGRAG